MKGKWSPGKITAVILGSIGAGIILLTTFYISVFQLARGILTFDVDSAKVRNEHEKEQNADKEEKKNLEERLEEFIREYEENPDQFDYDDSDSYENPENPEYYEFQDDIRSDLSYQVEFESYDEVLGANDNILIDMLYPVVYGEETANLSGINNAIQKELSEAKEYAESVEGWLSDGESYRFEADSYVTYMDEQVLSVIYVEYGYLDDEYYESYVISVNIDMESGLALTNSQLLDIDDEFSIEFRNRCERQNGEIDTLSIFSDQDITELLTDDASLIIFYTPLGMEVGFNYYYGWVTVTYQDYQKYKSHF